MKKVISLICFLLFTRIVVDAESNLAYTSLENIEDRVLAAFLNAQQTEDVNQLVQIDEELEQLYKQKKQNIIKYWRAYNQYYMAIYYLTKNKLDASEDYIDNGIDLLEDIKNKNSEDYALLSLMQGFSLQFKNIVTIILLSREVEKNGKKAIEKDNDNLRAYYSMASNDFYKPEKYGGGKHAEAYLLKAIKLPSQKIKNPYLPSWGKENAYEMLIKWYIRKENPKKAKKYYKEAISKYPNSYIIKQLKSKINN